MRMPENLYPKLRTGNLVSPSLLRGKSPDTGQRCPAYSAEQRVAQPISAKTSCDRALSLQSQFVNELEMQV